MAKTAKSLYGGMLAARLSETDEGYVLQYDRDYLILLRQTICFLF